MDQFALQAVKTVSLDPVPNSTGLKAGVIEICTAGVLSFCDKARFINTGLQAGAAHDSISLAVLTAYFIVPTQSVTIDKLS